MTALSYLSGLPFAADAFQVDAAEAIDAGESVVVTAPTGSGKTVIAEAAIARAHELGKRALYTTPLKALSNQKFGDFRAIHGDDRVGLLTGDNSINGGAAIVVMTTEVLRNMMYAGSPDLDDVETVILDEVHYLQDPSRGQVWEEIIVHLDRSISLVCLSATVANPEELAAWIRDRRGPTRLIIETERPVPLESTYLVRDTWESNSLRMLPVLGGDLRANQKVIRMLSPGNRRQGRTGPAGPQHRFASPRRHETCEFLASRGLLPAIYFIFSRRGCEAAAAQVVERGLRLTSRAEAEEIRAEADRHSAHLSDQDLQVLGYERFLRGLEAGVAAHHAGMVPAFKETVERLFERGLVRMVFATETLSVGINMPARTVVLEQLSKFTGDGHEMLQPGDYTQLTGRAGRRGIDDAGTAVVLHSQYVAFDRVAGIAAAGSHPLVSSLRPTYNMAVNLVARYERRQAETLLEASFAQFDEHKRREAANASIDRDERRLAEARAKAECERGDVWAALEASAVSRDKRMYAFAATTSPGDVLEWTERGTAMRYVVVARGHGKRPRLLAVGSGTELRRLAADRLPDEIAVAGRIDLPTPFRPRQTAYRRRVAEILSEWSPGGQPRTAVPPPAGDPCPDWTGHIAAARTVRRIEASLQRARAHLDRSEAGLVKRLDRILALLQRWGYTRGWALTDRGGSLRFIYNELDLLLAETLRAGLLEDLDGPGLAAMVSLFTFSPRGRDVSELLPPRAIADRVDEAMAIWERLTAAERSARLPETRAPEAGFASLAYRWTSGESLSDLFEDDEAGVGDFVRNCRQLIDLLRQVGDAAPHLAMASRAALAGMDRGVVAAAGAL